MWQGKGVRKLNGFSPTESNCCPAAPVVPDIVTVNQASEQTNDT